MIDSFFLLLLFKKKMFRPDSGPRNTLPAYSPQTFAYSPWRQPLHYIIPIQGTSSGAVAACSLKSSEFGCHTTSALGDSGTCCTGTCVRDARLDSGTTLEDGKTVVYRGKCT